MHGCVGWRGHNGTLCTVSPDPCRLAPGSGKPAAPADDCEYHIRQSELLQRVGREQGYGQTAMQFIDAAAQALWSAEEAGADLSTVTVESVEAEMRSQSTTTEISQVAYQTREAAQNGLASPQPAAKVIRFPQATERPASPPPPPISA